jgi:hypothetical protein
MHDGEAPAEADTETVAAVIEGLLSQSRKLNPSRQPHVGPIESDWRKRCSLISSNAVLEQIKLIIGAMGCYIQESPRGRRN